MCPVIDIQGGCKARNTAPSIRWRKQIVPVVATETFIPLLMNRPGYRHAEKAGRIHGTSREGLGLMGAEQDSGSAGVD